MVSDNPSVEETASAQRHRDNVVASQSIGEQMAGLHEEMAVLCQEIAWLREEVAGLRAVREREEQRQAVRRLVQIRTQHAEEDSSAAAPLDPGELSGER